VHELSVIACHNLIKKGMSLINTEYATADDVLKIAKMIESVQVSIGSQRKFSTDTIGGLEDSQQSSVPTSIKIEVVDAS
jgi:hypothetical protein